MVYGEVLVDLFAEPPAQRGRGIWTFPFRGVPGGAPCNVAAHLAHLGAEVSLIADFADDPMGDALRSMLEERAVDLRFSVTHTQARTPVATVLPLPGGDRTFRLYLAGSAVERAQPGEPASEVLFANTGWFHFGSVLLAFPNAYAASVERVRAAKRAGVVTSFDINVRPDVWLESSVEPRVMLDVLSHVDVLKISDEDFSWLQQEIDSSLKQPTDLLKLGPALVAYTCGSEGARLYKPDVCVSVPPPTVDVVDTTGAGDAFMAGLIHSFTQRGALSRADITAIDIPHLEQAGQHATECAGRTLTQKGALPPV